MARRLKFGGLVVAAIGGFLIRSTVRLAVSDPPIGFVFAGIDPRLLGLGLAAAGVSLATGAS